jgi:hypothetical protein
MAQSKSPKALEHFSRLNQAVYLHQPPANAGTGTSNGPDLILLLGWMDASPRHLSKYTTGYEKLYPSARIVAVTTSAIDAAFRTHAANLNRVKPVLDILYTLPPDAKLLVHFFSNGGAFTNLLIAKTYQEEMGRPLPATAIVLDSTPGRATYAATIRAFSVGLPKNVIVRAICLLILRVAWALYLLSYIIRGAEDIVDQARRYLNDKTVFELDTPRTYIYSVADDIVEWQDVEEHAKDAQGLGYTVDLVKYQASGHAAHMMSDEKRYWAAVQRLWDSVS